MRDGQLLEEQEIDKMYVDYCYGHTLDSMHYTAGIYPLSLFKEDMMLSARYLPVLIDISIGY
jgi:hypothetical protein